MLAWVQFDAAEEMAAGDAFAKLAGWAVGQ
jgi:hypothetical protein